VSSGVFPAKHALAGKPFLGTRDRPTASTSVWRRGGSSVGTHVVVPFMALSLVLGVVTSAMVSQQFGASAASRLDALAIKEEDAVGGSFDAFQQRQLTNLRLLSGTQGAAAAVSRARPIELRDLLFPAVATQMPDPIQAYVVGPNGREVLGMRADPNRPSRCLCSVGHDMVGWPRVFDVLMGRVDAQGPKYAGLVERPGGALLYSVGPVLQGDRVVGAIVVAEPLDVLLATIHRSNDFAIGVYQPDGRRLASTTDLAAGVGDLPAEQRARVMRPGVTPANVHRPVDGQSSSQVFFVPLAIRAQVAGYLAVVVPASVIGEARGQLPWILIGIFGSALLLTMLTGLFISRRLTQPLGRLLEATDIVARGQLAHRARVDSNNEIGKLTEHFNAMTRSLEQKTEELEATTEETVRALAAAIDARDAYTHGHSVRVANYSEVLARAAGLTEEQVETLRRGCLIHDIGKIGVPDRILGKRNRLTRTEAAVMRTHPVLGHRMLGHLRWYADVLEVVLHHHERWDGRGYPDQLAAEDIPLLARLTAIADTLDAMTSHRPYRQAFGFDHAAAEIESRAGTQFDPAMVEVFNLCRDRLRRLVDAEMSLGDPGEAAVQELVGVS